MKKSIVIMMLLSFLVAISYGCASKGYVKEQTDPLAERINKLETSCASKQQVDSLAEKVNKLEASSAASQADIDQAKKDAAEALQTANKSEAAAAKAEAAARKAFELHQRK